MIVYVVTYNAVEESLCKGIYRSKDDAIAYAESFAASQGCVEVADLSPRDCIVAMWKKPMYNISVTAWKLQ